MNLCYLFISSTPEPGQTPILLQQTSKNYYRTWRRKVPVPAEHGLEAGIGCLVKLKAQLGAGHHQLLTHDPTTTTTIVFGLKGYVPSVPSVVLTFINSPSIFCPFSIRLYYCFCYISINGPRNSCS